MAAGDFDFDEEGEGRHAHCSVWLATRIARSSYAMRAHTTLLKPASGEEKSAPCVAEWPNGSSCHATVGTAEAPNSCLIQRAPSAWLSAMETYSGLASSCMSQPPHANESWPFLTIACVAAWRAGVCSLYQRWKKPCSTSADGAHREQGA